MIKYKNAFARSDNDFNCFGCSPDNPAGLKMKFFSDKDVFWSEWEPDENHDGWKSVVHGGIQACLADETAEWYIFTQYGRSAVTYELNLKYIKPLRSNIGIIRVEVSNITFRKNIAEIDLTIIDSNGRICTTAKGKFLIFSEIDSKEKYNFPDKDEFI